jgi:hypothetical protein
MSAHIGAELEIGRRQADPYRVAAATLPFAAHEPTAGDVSLGGAATSTLLRFVDGGELHQQRWMLPREPETALGGQ